MNWFSFRRKIYAHYALHGRKLPWRETQEPYHILVSEVMLQQTPVERVVSKYELFIKAYPDIAALSKAKLRDVLTLWHGLGYNRRAKYLKEIAEIVAKKYRGKLPQKIEELEKLPGIGPSTAGAIAVFAFEKPHAFLETNIRTVFLHFFFRGRRNVHDREVLKAAEKMLDREHPREWHFALMDYGAMLKRTTGNENYRSAHYIKQSPFEGSGRELRGKILKKLLGGGRLTAEELAVHTGRSESEVALKIDELTREGLILVKGDVLTVA